VSINHDVIYFTFEIYNITTKNLALNVGMLQIVCNRVSQQVIY